MYHKNNLKQTLALGLSALLLSTSCSKDFLDKEPSQYVTPEQLSKASIWNSSILLGQVAGVTTTTFAKQQALKSSHDDFSQKAVDIQTDLLSSDMEMPSDDYPRFVNAAELIGTRKSQAAYSRTNFRIYYKMIAAANGIFDTMGSDERSSLSSEQSNSKENLYYWGASKVLRAYAYFNLANLYARPYDVDKSKPVLSIYRTATSTTPEGLSTLEEVYKLIINDLLEGKQAIKDSGKTRSNKSDIDANVASCVLAYTYLQTGEYAKAYTEAKSVIDDGAFELLTPTNLTTTGFNNVSNPEFIWAIDITNDNSGGLATFWGHVDYYTYSYASVGCAKLINKNLQAEIPDVDLRKEWFSHDKNGYALRDGKKVLIPDGAPIGKFFSTAKPTFQGDRSWTSDIHFYRLADMYLVGMEAAARNGNYDSAKALLKALMQQRTDATNWATVETSIDKLSNEELLEKIYYNWRVEMWGEGRALMTMKRFKKSVTRSDRSYIYQGDTFSYDDPRLTYEIPQSELSNNPMITQ